jgi:LuxR family maltose regulon positive regulatory protein
VAVGEVEGTNRALASARLGFELDSTRLAVPRSKRRFVARTALVRRLTRARGADVVMVTAPAGYGKTTLLAQWAARDRRPFACVALERRDNDPAVLMTYVAAALDSVYDVDAGVFEALAEPSNSIWTVDVPRLLAAFAGAPSPVVLALDDVHLIVDRDCRDVLDALAHHVPAGSHLALFGRSDGLPGLPRLRSQGSLLELGAGDLAFDDADARTLLQRSGLEVSDERALEVNARAEGWAAGLYLAALGSRHEPDHGVAVMRFAGDDRFVSDYLHSEHLSRLGRRRLEFLLRTSILERMSGPLCDAVLERTGSAKALDALERENLFVIPLDHHREWVRYHHLFRDMLRAELERFDPHLVPGLHRNAAAWYAKQGRPEEAIEHAVAAGDLDLVARCVAQHGFAYYRSGRAVTAEGWLAPFDQEDLLERYPAVAALGAVLHALRGRRLEAVRWQRALERSTDDGSMPDGSPRAAWIATVRAMICERGVEEMREDGRRAVETLSPASPFAAAAAGLLAVGTFLTGDDREGERLLQKALALAEAQQATAAGILVAAELALLALRRREHSLAERFVEEGWRFLPRGLVGEYAEPALLLAAEARLAIARGDVARARVLAAEAQPVRARLVGSLNWLGIQARLELARVQLALGNPPAGRMLLDEATQLALEMTTVGTLGDELEEVRALLRAASGPGTGWAMTLTTAELRLLPLLTTHLSFAEVAERLFVSRNTVKTQAISIYRKLDASSRSEAVARARELGLVDASVAAPVGV